MNHSKPIHWKQHQTSQRPPGSWFQCKARFWDIYKEAPMKVGLILLYDKKNNNGKRLLSYCVDSSLIHALHPKSRLFVNPKRVGRCKRVANKWKHIIETYLQPCQHSLLCHKHLKRLSIILYRVFGKNRMPNEWFKIILIYATYSKCNWL